MVELSHQWVANGKQESSRFFFVSVGTHGRSRQFLLTAYVSPGAGLQFPVIQWHASASPQRGVQGFDELFAIAPQRSTPHLRRQGTEYYFAHPLFQNTHRRGATRTCIGTDNSNPRHPSLDGRIWAAWSQARCVTLPGNLSHRIGSGTRTSPRKWLYHRVQWCSLGCQPFLG